MKRLFKNIKEYFSGIWKELGKVAWPSRQVAISHTLVVIVSAVIVMLLVSAIDFGLAKSIEYLLSLKK